MGTTTNYSLRYPEDTDAPDGPAQMQNLADDVDTSLAGVAALLPTYVVKPSDQSVTSSTTLVNDNDLKHTVAADTTYHVRGIFHYTASTTGDIQFVWTGPSGASVTFVVTCVDSSTLDTATTSRIGSLPSSSLAVGGRGTSFPGVIYWEGTLVTSSSSGTLQLQWAQNTSDGTATTVEAGSLLILTKIP
jgi:hypothetical protein